MDCREPVFPVLHHFLEFTQTHVHWVSNAIQPSHPLSSLSPTFCLSQHQDPMSWLFTSDGQSTGASGSASNLPMDIQDWFPLGLTVLISLGTLKNLLQHYLSKASILWCLAFFMVQLLLLYMTIGKNIALTIWASVHKVISLLYLFCLNMLSRFALLFFQGASTF